VSKEEIYDLPIDGTLDLHAFHPSCVRELLDDYLKICLENGILDLQIVHGKGTGALRRLVHSRLERSPFVIGFRLADESGGGWGATLVRLRDQSA
tara:strand:+ start:20522 stop:20806 length:285 start_codon:yes stop_codon:yes gene_type:complete